MIALALLVSAGLGLRDVQERARAFDPRVQQAAAQVQNAQAKREEVLVSWFPSIEATGYLAGPTPEHYLKGGAYDSNPSDPSHLHTLDYFWPVGLIVFFESIWRDAKIFGKALTVFAIYADKNIRSFHGQQAGRSSDDMTALWESFHKFRDVAFVVPFGD